MNSPRMRILWKMVVIGDFAGKEENENVDQKQAETNKKTLDGKGIADILYKILRRKVRFRPINLKRIRLRSNR